MGLLKVIFAVLICIPFAYLLFVLIYKTIENINAQYKRNDKNER